MKPKYLAGTSLAVMGAGFLGTFPFYHTAVGGVIHGGFEAGLVGGLADWFAVTALFRHPLNIPIPHTALLPKNREKMTKALVGMLENEWLTKESITEKLKQVHLVEYVIENLEKQLHNQSLQKGLVAMLEKAIHQIPTEKLAEFIEEEGKKYLHTIDTRNLLSTAVDYFMQNKYDEKVFDFLLEEVIEWLKKEDAQQLLGKLAMNAINNVQQDGFFQFVLKSIRSFLSEEKLGTALQNALVNGLPSLKEAGNDNREVLLQQIHKGLTSVSNSEDVIDNLEKWKSNFINDWDMNAQITKLLEHSKEKMLVFIQQDGFYEEHCLPLLMNGINRFKENEESVTKLEDLIQDQIVRIVEKNHGKIGSLVSENLNKLDNGTLTEMIENGVGKELQWVRVNGAICGFMIGIGLEAIKLLI